MIRYSQRLILVEHRVDSRASERISAVSRAVVAGRQGVVRHFLSHHESAHRNAAAERFGGSHDIGLNAEFLPGVHIACSSHAALYFVKDQKDILFVAEFSHCPKELLLRGNDAALALHDFHDDGTGLISHSGNDAVHVVHLCESCFTGHCAESFPVVAVAGD